MKANDLQKKDKLLKLILDRLTLKYPVGLYEWLYRDNPDVYKQINMLEDGINDNFSRNESLSDLKALLREYWILHAKAMLEYEQAGKPEMYSEEVRSERIETLETEHIL